MKLSQFNFKLPAELIAMHPNKERDDARLMVVNRRTGQISHHIFREILDFFDDGDVMVFNDTKVFPALLYGNKEKTGARIEVFLLRELNVEQKFWDVLVEPARKIRIGNKLYFGEDESMVAEVIDNTTSRGRTLRFLFDGSHEEFKQALYALGTTPLPPYIKRESTSQDAVDYQCIFAQKEGAVVAPAAGLHFSRRLLTRLQIKGVKNAYITVHSGLGAFREIDVEDLTKHRMDSEEMIASEELVNTVNNAHDNEKKICAIGTSVLRAISTAESMGGHMKTYSGWTNKFIFPPYNFTVCDNLVTNFHMPYSTMLMMVSAFGGYDLIMKAYETAVQERYRFGCFGDAMLII